MVIHAKQVEAMLKKYGRSSLDHYKLWHKQYLDLSDDAVAAYGIARGAMIVLEDPIGPLVGLDSQINTVIQYAKRHKYPLAFLEVRSETIDHYRFKDFKIIKIGEIVRINVSHFLNTTKKVENLRYKRNRATREGYQLQILEPPLTNEQYETLKEISEVWLSGRNRHEQGFATGYFEPDYIRHTRSYALLDKNQKIIAFTTQTPSYKPGELIIDVVRYLPNLANGAIEYLVMLVIEAASQEGYRLLNLGMTPLAGIDKNPSNIYEKFMAFYYRHFNWPLNVKGLRIFKDQFDPEYEDCYIVCQKGLLKLIRIGLGAAKLVAVKPKKRVYGK